MLMNPAIADYIQAYGEGGLRAKRLGKLTNLARVYWYTVEFGLLRQKEGLRIYGAGIASSRTESVFSLDDPSPNRIAFDLKRVMRTNYRIDDFQETYFVVRDLDELLDLAAIDFGPTYERVRDLPDFEPGTVLATNTVITRRTGTYHDAKRPKATP
jgi:phenylalanine-4-hydroxylase